jgi:hypothetical protein
MHFDFRSCSTSIPRSYGILACLTVLLASVGCSDDGAGGGTGGGSTSSAGGAGGSECSAPQDCPGSDTECQTRTCVAGTCGFSFVAEGSPLAEQETGDCRNQVCDGKGGVTDATDATDVLDDGNDCTDDLCDGSMPGNAPSAAGTACGSNGGSVCDGDGACVECASGTDCASGVCSNGTCAAPTCADAVKNGSETDVDCGGTDCSACALGDACASGSDCETSVCSADVCAHAVDCAALRAANPSLTDGVYTIDTDGDGPQMPFDVHCDMTTDGGGWTLLANLRTTDAYPTVGVGMSWGAAWSDDWWAKDHGAPTSPAGLAADTAKDWKNHDMRKFKPRIGSGTILRATTPANMVKRYHFGFVASDWDFWNAGRSINTTNVVGPFNLTNVKVSTSVALTNPKQALCNGQWYDGGFLLGTVVQGIDADSEGLAARFHVGSTLAASYGFAGDQRVNTGWSLWLR